MTIEHVDHILKTARSVRRRLDFDKPVPLSVLQECIAVAAQAPTGLGGENWRFVIVTDADKKLELANLYRGTLAELATSRGIEVKQTQRALSDRLHEIPCMMLVCAIGEPGIGTAAQVAFYGSVLPAAWSLMLALRNRGLGTTWTTLLSANQSGVAEILGIPDGVTQTVMLPVAYTKDAVMKEAERLPAAEVTYINQWGSTNDQ